VCGCDGVVGCQGRCQLAGGCVKYGDGQWAGEEGCQMSGGFQFGGCCGCFSESRMPGYSRIRSGEMVTEGFGWVIWRARCLCVHGGCNG
jgi:hypothetical protein